MRFSDSFKIMELPGEEISLAQALKLARDDDFTDLLYDPLGIDGPASWWWCATVLEKLQQEDLIREFEVLKEAPADQQIEAKEGVDY